MTELMVVVKADACWNCAFRAYEHCDCHRSCPGQCPPEDETDRIYRTLDRRSFKDEFRQTQMLQQEPRSEIDPVVWVTG